MAKNEKEPTKLWKDYQDGLSYQSAMGFNTTFPKCVDFFEGRQWANATKNTKNMPRPVVNFTKMIARNKKSNIMGTPVRLVYRTRDKLMDGAVEKFNRFSDYIVKELRLDRIDDDAMDDGVIKGTYVEHFYWDAEAEGADATAVGGLRAEVVDPLRVFFANPQEIDEQKQEWIIIMQRETVSAVRAKADKGVKKDDIMPDEYDEEYHDVQEQDGTKLVTTLLRYFRKGGEVYWERATKSCVVNAPRALTPNLQKVLSSLADTSVDEEGVDAPNDATPDKGNPSMNARSKCYLYPVVVGQYERRQGSIFGIGEVESLIPNQKVVNFTLGMQALNIQNNAWGKYIAMPGALKDQTITNDPGQVLTDYTGTGGGIKKLTEQPLHTEVTQIVDAMISMSRSATGSTEVMTGETIGANTSGAAIAQLQTQAKVPIKVLRDAYWRFKEKQGEILAQFYTNYYGDVQFFYDERNEETGKIDTFSEVFNSTDFAGKRFEVCCEATQGTNSSTAGDITALDNLFEKGAIDVESYIDAYPDDALSNKTELREGVRKTRQSQVAQLTDALAKAEAQATQLADIVERQNKAIDSVMKIIGDNKQLRETLAQLYTESYNKIMAQNAQIGELTKDAQDMAITLATSGVVKPQPVTE